MSFTRSKSARKRRRNATSKSRGAGSRKSSANGKATRREPDSLFTPTTGNIFEDAGFPPHEARRLLLRSQLAIVVTDVIKQRSLTQARAARLFGVTQPRISDLIRGKIELFSLDALVEMVDRAGIDVGLTLKPKAA